MNIKKYFIKIFDILGYRIKLVKKAKKVHIKNSVTKGITFEMIGTSGIGKTFFHSKASKVLNYYWNLDYYKTNGQQSTKSNSFLDDFYLLSISLALQQFYNNKNNRDFEQNIRLLYFYSEMAKKDRYLKTSGLLNHSGWFLDDSFCHNFAPQIVEIIEKKLISEEVLNKFFSGRKFLLLEAPLDYIINNLKKRRSTIKGSLNDYLSIYGEEYIREFVREMQINCRKLVELSSQFGAFTWNLDLSEGDDIILKKIKEIEADIISKKN